MIVVMPQIRHGHGVRMAVFSSMDLTPDLSWARLANFVRQHTHDVRNHLNGLDLEAALLADLLPEGEAAESAARIRAQIRQLATEMRVLAAKFADQKPTLAPIAGRELFLIWQDQLASLSPAPQVTWKDELGGQQVNVDVAALASVFRELLANAKAFGTGAPLKASARMGARQVMYELREPKEASVDTANWGKSPFVSTRRGGYGLGLWEVERAIAASGGEVKRRFELDTKVLGTTITFPTL